MTRPRYEIVGVHAESAPREIAWAILEDGKAVDYRPTKAEARAAVAAIRSFSATKEATR